MKKPSVSIADRGVGLQRRLLNPKSEAAYQLGISVRSLEYFLASGDLKFKKIGHRILIAQNELERFARSNHYGRVDQLKKVQDDEDPSDAINQ